MPEAAFTPVTNPNSDGTAMKPGPHTFAWITLGAAMILAAGAAAEGIPYRQVASTDSFHHPRFRL